MDDILELEQLAVNINEKLNNANFELMGSIELSSLRRELEDLHAKNLAVKDKLRFDKTIDTADYDEYSRKCEKMWEFVQRRLPPVIEAQRNKIHAAQERLKRKREIELLQKFNAENIKRLEEELAEVTNHFNNAGTKELKEVYEVPMKALQKAIEKCKKLYVKYDKELAILIHDMNALMKGGELTPIKPKRKYTRRKKTEVEEVKEEVKEETKEAIESVSEAHEVAEEVKQEEEKKEEEKVEPPRIVQVEPKPVVKEQPKVEVHEEPKVEVKEEPTVVVPHVETKEEHAQKFADSLPPLLPGFDEGSKPDVREFPKDDHVQDESDDEEKSNDIYDKAIPIIPRIKGRNTRLTKKVLKTIALTIGVGGAVYLMAGPVGLGALAIGAYAGKKYFEHKYAHLLETHMSSFGGSVKVEKIEEPSETIIDRIRDIKDFLKTDEGREKFREIINERIENQTIFSDFTNTIKKFRPVEQSEEPVVETTIEHTEEYTPVEGGMSL